MFDNLPEAEFWPATTSGLPVISELSSGCFESQVRAAIFTAGYSHLDAQKIQALLGNVSKECFIVTVTM